MKLATFRHDDRRKVGIVEEQSSTISPFKLTLDESAGGIQLIIERQVTGLELPAMGEAIALADVQLEAPIPRPRRNIFCVGKNYFDHAHEFASSGFDSSAAQGSVPAHPIVFSKVPESVTATHTCIEYDPDVSDAIDYEVELAVIIGKPGRGIAKQSALNHVWGYTIVNDVTARDLQGRYSQWLIGKSQDTFCPMGPYAVSKDAVDLADTTVRTWVNDELRQDSNTGLLIFDVPTIIATISEGLTLLPGDIIATGTPAGVGIGYKPPKYLTHGDVVRTEIAGIGCLENTLKNRQLAS
ncbi:MAG: fumarylacetoacetate hydrolase family protein [Granulosicoccus sp.]|nr:fumarylacetoacetate hydrolase family protein [Granulosicoccus sp.]